jgi:hypothetical protein
MPKYWYKIASMTDQDNITPSEWQSETHPSEQDLLTSLSNNKTPLVSNKGTTRILVTKGCGIDAETAMPINVYTFRVNLELTSVLKEE